MNELKSDHICRKCKLSDGRIINYDACGETKFGADAPYLLLGTGKIYSINGVRDHSNRVLYFYMKIRYGDQEAEE